MWQVGQCIQLNKSLKFERFFTKKRGDVARENSHRKNSLFRFVEGRALRNKLFM